MIYHFFYVYLDKLKMKIFGDLLQTYTTNRKIHFIELNTMMPRASGIFHTN